ncbi:hypothetical protein M7I_0521 [Glarea lozoyensis 74030]|uniref:Uncharacterized protein n=1 Tax=Glarea lozoyensis (strain ATCC 74030 / MF5533) TaxID=1104152 RepID=H0EDR6_GLAL7|nr:hypothetical protein M7I_0521 [Glarea lozoyensis 74030]
MKSRIVREGRAILDSDSSLCPRLILGFNLWKSRRGRDPYAQDFSA